MSLLILIVGILLFSGLILIHEFGHFIMARRNGVEVEEFGLFFPPSLYRHKTKGGWVFSINAIPLGGFVKLKGEHDSDTEKGSFGAASLLTKTKIMIAGVAMNLITAIILFTILALVGIPKIIPNQFTVSSDTKSVAQKVLVNEVEPNSPAAKIGLKTNDELTAIGKVGSKPVAINSTTDLPNVTKRFAGDKVNVYFVRDGKPTVATTTLLSASVVTASQKAYEKKVNSSKLDCVNIPQPKGYLGISQTGYSLQRSTWSAPVTAVGFSAQITGLTFQGIGTALSGLGSYISGTITGNQITKANGECSATSNLTGPLGIFFILKDNSALGFDFMLFLIANLSLALAIMNILPIPVLDGGKLWFTLIAHAIKKPLSAKAEDYINIVGLVVLLTLFVLITIADVHRFI